MKLFFLIADLYLQSIRRPSSLFLTSVFEKGANWISKSMRNVIRWWGGVGKLAHLSSVLSPPPRFCFVLRFILLYSYQYAMRKSKGHDHDNLA